MRPALPLRLLLCAAALALPAAAAASPTIRFGVDDEAWLRTGPGTLEERLGTLQRLGADVARVTVRWEEPDWRRTDAVVRGLRARGIEPLVVLAGPDAWAKARPTRAPAFGVFAGSAARRWPWIGRWAVWERPNRRLGATVYTARLLRPAYAAIKREAPRALVAAGEPVALGAQEWMRALDRTRAPLDALLYRPASAAQFAPALRQAARSFPGTPVWVTDSGAQTGRGGVSEAMQARELGAAALRAYRARSVELLLHGPVRDAARRQSGLFTVKGAAKMAAHAFPFPLAQHGRQAEAALVWGQVRPRTGRQPFRLQLVQGGETAWLGGVRTTSRRGYFTAVVDAPPGALIRVWSLRDRLFSAPLLLE